MSEVEEQLVEALNHAAAGDWSRAHEIVQAHEDHPIADWIHAVVHRVEGDLDNAGYWYRRCGKKPVEDLAVEDELPQIRAALAAR